jgi:hypothetical protein
MQAQLLLQILDVRRFHQRERAAAETTAHHARTLVNTIDGPRKTSSSQVTPV